MFYFSTAFINDEQQVEMGAKVITLLVPIVQFLNVVSDLPASIALLPRNALRIMAHVRVR